MHTIRLLDSIDFQNLRLSEDVSKFYLYVENEAVGLFQESLGSVAGLDSLHGYDGGRSISILEMALNHLNALDKTAEVSATATVIGQMLAYAKQYPYCFWFID